MNRFQPTSLDRWVPPGPVAHQRQEARRILNGEVVEEPRENQPENAETQENQPESWSTWLQELFGQDWWCRLKPHLTTGVIAALVIVVIVQAMSGGSESTNVPVSRETANASLHQSACDGSLEMQKLHLNAGQKKEIVLRPGCRVDTWPDDNEAVVSAWSKKGVNYILTLEARRPAIVEYRLYMCTAEMPCEATPPTVQKVGL